MRRDRQFDLPRCAWRLDEAASGENFAARLPGWPRRAPIDQAAALARASRRAQRSAQGRRAFERHGGTRRRHRHRRGRAEPTRAPPGSGPVPSDRSSLAKDSAPGATTAEQGRAAASEAHRVLTARQRFVDGRYRLRQGFERRAAPGAECAAERAAVERAPRSAGIAEAATGDGGDEPREAIEPMSVARDPISRAPSVPAGLPVGRAATALS